MPSLSIRPYRPADAEQVWHVHEAAFRASPIEFIEDADADEDLRHVDEQYLEGSGCFLVGELDDIVVIGGFKPADETTVELRRMRVHPSHQRQGVGRALLKELETRARHRGFERAVLETHIALQPAMDFYESQGYEETERYEHAVAKATFVRYEKRL